MAKRDSIAQARSDMEDALLELQCICDLADQGGHVDAPTWVIPVGSATRRAYAAFTALLKAQSRADRALPPNKVGAP